MQSTVLRCGAFSGSALKAAPACKPVQASRGSLCVRAAQEAKGVVVSSKTQKTVIVEVERFAADVTYEKRQKKTTRFHAHDEASVAKVGDFVRLTASRPMSKTKRFAVAEVLRKAE